MVRSFTLYPSTRTSPSCASKKRPIRLMILVFPAPVGPTRRSSPGLNMEAMLSRTSARLIPKETFLKITSPLIWGSGIAPSLSLIAGSISRISKIRSAPDMFETRIL